MGASSIQSVEVEIFVFYMTTVSLFRFSNTQIVKYVRTDLGALVTLHG